jgi:uncharacterized membrane protein
MFGDIASFKSNHIEIKQQVMINMELKTRNNETGAMQARFQLQKQLKQKRA